MKRKLTTWQEVLIQVVAVAGILTIASACALPPVEIDPSVEVDWTVIGNRLPYEQLIRIEDDESRTVCFFYRDYEGIALQCIPFSQRY